MAPIVTTAEVDRPASEVFAYATDPTRFHQWQQGVVDGRLDSSGDLKVGDQCHMTRRIGGSNRPSTSLVTHVDPPCTWGVRGVDGPIRATVDVTVEPVSDARSRLTIGVDFAGHGIGKLLVPLVVRGQARKEMPANLARLKARLETTKPPDPSAAGGAGAG
jgi:Polyketide cyclase / dehydrase and lipid transport